MDLHQQAVQDVECVLAQYTSWLSAFRGCLDVAVQEAGGYWEDPQPDFRIMDACTRMGHVRAFAGGLTAKLPQCKPRLDLKVVSFSGLHLYTQDGQRIRTRTHPKNAKTGLPMRVVQRGARLTLFGPEAAPEPYEISVLLSVDLRTKTLACASLAAVDWGEDDKGRAIYHEVEIPPPPVFGVGSSSGDGSPPKPHGPSVLDDDFRDLLGAGEEVVGTDPA